MHLNLALLPDTYAVCRLPASDPVPDWALRGRFTSVTRTPAELSIVCRAADVGVRAGGGAAERIETGFRALVVRGPLPFSIVGVVAAIASPLAQAGISLFILSTFDTDYVLLKEARLHDAARALRDAGHDVDPPEG
jgi:hypothetical protein